ncbi:CHASE2 domain-containing protein [Hoeflea sp. TYP-13]|uniref:CHASE2 domain-containing protein n=1 Tax=Hoeflea sp. TYP-13 TaxID=3230023 RepID=UPI0034C66B81
MAIYAGLFSLALLFVAASFGAPLFDRLSSMVFDEYQRLKPRPPAGAPLLIVDIDETAINEIGQWPWPRSQMALLVDRLGELGAAVIAFDIAFSEKDRTSLRETLTDLRRAGAEVRFPDGVPELDNDVIFTRIIERNPTVMGLALTNELTSEIPDPKAGFAYGGRDPKEILPPYHGGLVNLDSFDNAATGLGFFSFPPAVDGVVRKIPLIASANGKLYPSLGIEALRVAQQAANFVVMSTGASGEAEAGSPAIIGVRVGAFDAPTDGDGSLWLYYSGKTNNNTISARELLAEPLDRNRLEERVAGHIVLVGTSAVGLRDLVVTPLGSGVPGVTVHAEMIDQILSGTFLHRPDYMPGLEYFLAVVATILLIVTVRPGQPFVGAAMTLALLLCILTVSWSFFVTRQILLDPLLPALATILVFIAVTIAQYLSSEREKRFIRNAFGRYLAPSMVNRLSDDPQSLKLGGELRELTLLFCDIRGFTSLSEELDPEELTRLLNDFLTPMTDELLKSGATIDKYMGDAIMAFWNAPLSVPDHREAAMRAALAMMQRLHALNTEKGSDLKIGIGLNTGRCCVGNLGSSQRFNYSAIGDAVNVAARIEGVTKAYGLPVLLENSVLADGAADNNDEVILEVDAVRVVGREEPLILHTVFDRKELNGSSCEELVGAQSAFLASYRSGDFKTAIAQAKSLQKTAPVLLEGLYSTYLSRLENLAAAPPENWDGVHQFDEK